MHQNEFTVSTFYSGDDSYDKLWNDALYMFEISKHRGYNQFRCASFPYEFVKHLSFKNDFEPIYPDCKIKKNDSRIVGLYQNVTIFQNNFEPHKNYCTLFFSGNYGCEGSRVK